MFRLEPFFIPRAQWTRKVWDLFERWWNTPSEFSSNFSESFWVIYSAEHALGKGKYSELWALDTWIVRHLVWIDIEIHDSLLEWGLWDAGIKLSSGLGLTKNWPTGSTNLVIIFLVSKYILAKNILVVIRFLILVPWPRIRAIYWGSLNGYFWNPLPLKKKIDNKFKKKKCLLRERTHRVTPTKT